MQDKHLSRFIWLWKPLVDIRVFILNCKYIKFNYVQSFPHPFMLHPSVAQHSLHVSKSVPNDDLLEWHFCWKKKNKFVNKECLDKPHTKRQNSNEHIYEAYKCKHTICNNKRYLYNIYIICYVSFRLKIMPSGYNNKQTTLRCG